MAWENVIVGYKIIEFEEDDIIPNDAVFIHASVRTHSSYSFGTHSWVVFFFKVPIYKKENIKRKQP